MPMDISRVVHVGLEHMQTVTERLLAYHVILVIIILLLVERPVHLVRMDTLVVLRISSLAHLVHKEPFQMERINLVVLIVFLELIVLTERAV